MWTETRTGHRERCWGVMGTATSKGCCRSLAVQGQSGGKMRHKSAWPAVGRGERRFCGSSGQPEEQGFGTGQRGRAAEEQSVHPAGRRVRWQLQVTLQVLFEGNSPSPLVFPGVSGIYNPCICRLSTLACIWVYSLIIFPSGVVLASNLRKGDKHITWDMLLMRLSHGQEARLCHQNENWAELTGTLLCKSWILMDFNESRVCGWS